MDDKNSHFSVLFQARVLKVNTSNNPRENGILYLTFGA
jgi:hypothetical protein